MAESPNQPTGDVCPMCDGSGYIPYEEQGPLEDQIWTDRGSFNPFTGETFPPLGPVRLFPRPFKVDAI